MIFGESRRESFWVAECSTAPFSRFLTLIHLCKPLRYITQTYQWKLQWQMSRNELVAFLGPQVARAIAGRCSCFLPMRITLGHRWSSFSSARTGITVRAHLPIHRRPEQNSKAIWEPCMSRTGNGEAEAKLTMFVKTHTFSHPPAPY